MFDIINKKDSDKAGIFFICQLWGEFCKGKRTTQKGRGFFLARAFLIFR